MGNPIMQALRLVGRAIATIVVVVWLAFEFVLLPLIRPAVAWLSSLRVFERIGAWIAVLPPYAVLVLLAIPFVLVEPLKAIGLYWMATGLFVRGLFLFVFAHLLSLLTLDRIYHAGRSQLLKIRWFAQLIGWLVELRDRAFGWVKSSWAWKTALSSAAVVGDWTRRLVRSIRQS